MNVIINYRQSAIRFSTRLSDEVFAASAPRGSSGTRKPFRGFARGWNGLPEDFCDCC